MKVNDILENNQGNKLKVLAIQGRRVKVEFNNSGFVKTVDRYHLLDGKAKDPYEPTKYGIACLGNIKSYPVEDYKRWENMIERCYRDGGVGNYKDCYVCDRWLVFEYFYEDLQTMENYGKPKIHLDKDLRIAGNKTYSLETCQLVDDNFNSSKGSFTGKWKATKGHTVIYSSYSSELAQLIGVTGPAVRLNSLTRAKTSTGWRISVEE